MILEAIVNGILGNPERARYRRYAARREERERHKARYEASQRLKPEPKPKQTYTYVEEQEDGRVTDKAGNEYVQARPLGGYYYALTEATAKYGNIIRLRKKRRGKLVAFGDEWQHVGDGKYTRSAPPSKHE
jgi:hypothetical protein